MSFRKCRWKLGEIFQHIPGHEAPRFMREPHLELCLQFMWLKLPLDLDPRGYQTKPGNCFAFMVLPCLEHTSFRAFSHMVW